MIAPEQWYEYQKQYQKYGIDMKPESDRVPISERRKQKKKALLSRGVVLNVSSDHRLMLYVISICVVVLLSIVILASASAKITYDINKIKASNEALSGEIEDLDVQILSSSTITYIESQAKGELGMKNADSKHCIYLSSIDTPEEGFADILKEKAYN
ncbi:MAG: hypothetical protein ACI4KL_06580 [Lentihominibacter sp.]